MREKTHHFFFRWFIRLLAHSVKITITIDVDYDDDDCDVVFIFKQCFFFRSSLSLLALVNLNSSNFHSDVYLFGLTLAVISFVQKIN